MVGEWGRGYVCDEEREVGVVWEAKLAEWGWIYGEDMASCVPQSGRVGVA